MRKAIFIDKDGTLVQDVPYNVDPKLVTFEHNAIEGLMKLSFKDYLLIVVTNQSGLAHGYFNEHQLESLRVHITTQLHEKGIKLDGFYYCPHFPGGIIKSLATTCDCRKPMPGLLYAAAAHFNIDLQNSWMIGDILNDVEAGNRAGCRSILIDNGNETEWIMDSQQRTPFYVAKDMCNAADCISRYANASTSQLYQVKE